MKKIFLLFACALGLSAACKSDAPVGSDAGRDAPTMRDAVQPDTATDGIGSSGDVATSPADALSKPDGSNPDTASALVADSAHMDGEGKDSAATNDLPGEVASDLRPPALDLPADLRTPVADALGGDTRGEAECSGWTTLKRLSPAEVSSLVATSDPIVINVHIPYAGDIPGTDTSVPYDNVDAIETYLGHDYCADVVLICLSGGMSQSAGNELVKRGYLRVRDLDGGMQAWQAAGYPVLKDGGS